MTRKKYTYTIKFNMQSGAPAVLQLRADTDKEATLEFRNFAEVTYGVHEKAVQGLTSRQLN